MEELFDKDITIINKYFDKTSRTNRYKVSYVKGFWSYNDGISINGTQLIKIDGLSARILLNDKRNKKYQTPQEFIKNPDRWTLQNDDYLVKGRIEDFSTVAKLLEDYQEVMKITGISIKDYGPKDIQHFVIVGA